MPVVQVVGHRPGAGKTSLIGALLAGLQGQGLKAVYYKPFSLSPDNDQDLALVAGNLLSAEAAPEVTAPRPLPQGKGGQAALERSQGDEAAQTVARLEATAGLVLVEGPDLALPDGGESSLAVEVASRINSRVFLVVPYDSSLDPDMVARSGDLFGDRLAGVVLNGVPVYRRHKVMQGLSGGLRARGIPYLGAIPEDRAMLSVTVEQIAQHLGGRWVQEPVGTDAWVHHFLIGANMMDPSLGYLGRYQDQAVIVRAQRPDIQLASLMTDTRFLILTGGIEPIEYIKVEAMQRDVPVMLVDGDTLDTAEAVGRLLGGTPPLSVQKLRRFGQLMQEHLDMAALNAALGL